MWSSEHDLKRLPFLFQKNDFLVDPCGVNSKIVASPCPANLPQDWGVAQVAC